MSDNIKTDIEKKLSEYGIFIHNDYPIEDEEQHVYIVDDMILFLSLADNSLAISFNASLKPETSAKNLLLLEEIKNITRIDVMESHIINNKNKIISGEKAYELLEKSNRSQVLIEHLKSEQYIRILESSKCFNC